jgi:hypothetical protein
MSLCSSSIFSTYYYCVERPDVEFLMVSMTSRLPSDQNIKRKNISVLETKFLHYCSKIKETTIVVTASNTL